MPATTLAYDFTHAAQPDFSFYNLTSRLYHAWQYRGALALTSSFGVQSGLLVDQLHKRGLLPEIPVVTVDIPGSQWDDQRRYRDHLQNHYGFDLHVEHAENEDDKTAALNRGLSRLGVRATLDGIRASQTFNRAQKPFIEDKPDGRIAIHPLLDWSDRRVDKYIRKRLTEVARHPAWEKGARSKGGVVLAPGFEKTECGLHI